MSPNNVCPSCGAALEENVGNACPFCGSALGVSSSAPTILSLSKKEIAQAQSSAEVMDEIKKHVREGDTAGAAEVASAEFGLNQESAEATIEQISTEMKYSGREPKIVEPEPVQPVVENRPFDEPKKPANSRNWIIGGGIAAAVFLCLCCCLPLLIAIVTMARDR
jgi:cell pole-organizing protein PopZ